MLTFYLEKLSNIVTVDRARNPNLCISAFSGVTMFFRVTLSSK